MPEGQLVGMNAHVLPVLETWGWEIATALFLGGCGAGILIVSNILRLRGAASSGVVRVADLLGFPIVAGTAFFLWVDLGDRMNIWRIYIAFQPASVMWWGSWIVAFSLGLLGLRLLARILRRQLPWERVLASAGVALGLGLGAYTGFLLASIGARPLWATPVLPLLFLASGVGTGTTLLWLASADGRHRLERADHVLWVVELVVVVLYLLALRLGSDAQREALGLLTGGTLALAFWGVTVVLGLVIPIAVTVVGELRHLRRPTAALAIANIAGSLSLRLVVVYAGVASRL